MKRYVQALIIALIGIGCIQPSTLFGQSVHKKRKEINWSLNISKRNDSIQNTYLNLGLLTNIYQQTGMGINLVSSIVRHQMKGLQVSGIMNFAGNNMYGLQIGGLANIVRNNASGCMLSGLMNATGGDAKGLGVAGIVNVTGKSFDGLAIGGLLNISSGTMSGVQLSTILNASGGIINGVQASLLTNVAMDATGVQSSLISNIAAERVRGLQLSGVANVTTSADKAVQLASLTNICLDKLNGVQLALGNLAQDINQGVQVGLLNLSTGKVTDGWQIGLINHSKDSTVHKIGLVNINPKTKIQVMFYAGNMSKLNMAVRFKNRLNYSILGVGSHYLDLNDKFSGCFFYRTGLYFPIKKKFEVSGDLGFFHIENFENEDAEIPERMYSLQARISLEYRVLRKLGIFVSSGYSMTRYYKKNKSFDNKPIIEGGIVLF